MEKIIFSNLDILAKVIDGKDLTSYRDDFLAKARSI